MRTRKAKAGGKSKDWQRYRRRPVVKKSGNVTSRGSILIPLINVFY